ncbi:hypothetical protein IKF84_00430 [Candidatus Saccharibacteria bacterium]|nr:hypothetical protein [Candidatus Saccharibacteria bacterium]
MDIKRLDFVLLGNVQPLGQIKNAAPAGVSAMERITLVLELVVGLDIQMLVSIVVLIPVVVVILFGIIMGQPQPEL